MINKEEYINELEKVLQYFYEAKTTGDKEQIKYFQGMSKGIILILKKLEILNDEELKNMVKNAELEVPTVYREGK